MCGLVSSVCLIFFLSPVFIFVLYLRAVKKCKSKVCLVGKTALVTGGSKGIGLEIALQLASRGCKVIVGCRSKCEDVENLIKSHTNNPHIEVLHLDLQSLDSVRKFSKDVHQTNQQIDILINNAGIWYSPHESTVDGLNPVMQTNYFGHFLLTHLLVDLLKKPDGGDNSRIVFIGSCLALLHNLTLDTLNYRPGNKLKAPKFYMNSKLCILIQSGIFAEVLRKYNVTSNVVHPGMVKTDFFEQALDALPFAPQWYRALFHKMTNISCLSADDGIQPVINAAISEDMKNVTGKFLWGLGDHWKPSKLQDRDFCLKIFKDTEQLVHLKSSESLLMYK